MSIALVTFGNKEVGLGHLSRSRNLIDPLKGRGQDVIIIQNSNPFNIDVDHLIEESNYELFLDALKESLHSLTPDIVVLDLPYKEILLKKIPEFLVNFKRINVVAFDFFDYKNDYVHSAINLFNHYFENNELKIKVYEGIKYANIRREFWNLRNMKKLTDETDTIKIIISCGGSDPSGNTLKALELCFDWIHQGYKLDIIVITNTDLKSYRDLNFKLVSSPSNFHENIFNSDIAMLSGGTTVLEACYLGTPIVAFPQNQEEEGFFLSLQNKGLVLLSNSLERDKILDSEERKIISDKQRLRVDEKGIERICEIIIGDTL